MNNDSMVGALRRKVKNWIFLDSAMRLLAIRTCWCQAKWSPTHEFLEPASKAKFLGDEAADSHAPDGGRERGRAALGGRSTIQVRKPCRARLGLTTNHFPKLTGSHGERWSGRPSTWHSPVPMMTTASGGPSTWHSPVPMDDSGVRWTVNLAPSRAN